MGKRAAAAPVMLQTRRLSNRQALVNEHGRPIQGIKPLADTREVPYAWYFNQYGEAMELPADGPLLQAYLAQGFTLYPPEHPKKKPQGLAGTGVDPSGEEYRNLWDNGFRREGWTEPAPREVATQGGAIPTLTYYTKAGTSFEGLADPESMGKYLEMGMSLDPPESGRARGAQKETS